MQQGLRFRAWTFGFRVVDMYQLHVISQCDVKLLLMVRWSEASAEYSRFSACMTGRVISWYLPRPSSYPLLGPKYPLLGTIYPQLRVQGGSWYMAAAGRSLLSTNFRTQGAQKVLSSQTQKASQMSLACILDPEPGNEDFPKLWGSHGGPNNEEYSILGPMDSLDFGELLNPKATRSSTR